MGLCSNRLSLYLLFHPNPLWHVLQGQRGFLAPQKRSICVQKRNLRHPLDKAGVSVVQYREANEAKIAIVMYTTKPPTGSDCWGFLLFLRNNQDGRATNKKISLYHPPKSLGDMRETIYFSDF